MSYTIRDAFRDVVSEGVHLSAAFEKLFSANRYDSAEARVVRHRLLQAVRYRDIDAAERGSMDHYSDPERFLQTLPEFLRASVEPHAAALVEDPPTFIRVNTLKTSTSKVHSAMYDYGAKVRGENCIELMQPFGMYQHWSFHDGWWETQDFNSQTISRLLRATPGKRVVDLCAGAGGKTLHIAALMENRGRIVALDVKESALHALHARAKRAGAENIETRLITSTKTVKRLADGADAVLVDVPCTGIGVLRRNPDITMRLTQQSLDDLIVQQADILQRGARIVRPGGVLVYATCSVLPEEGANHIESFIEKNPEYTLTHTQQYGVGENGGDGFFVAVIERQ